MRIKTVKRCYCDHCPKSLGRAHSMAKHELACTLNPERKCRMCQIREEVQVPTVELIAAAKIGLKELQQAANGCPACTLTAIRLLRKAEPSGWDGDGHIPGGAPDSLGEFNFKEALKDFWVVTNALE